MRSASAGQIAKSASEPAQRIVPSGADIAALGRPGCRGSQRDTGKVWMDRSECALACLGSANLRAVVVVRSCSTEPACPSFIRFGPALPSLPVRSFLSSPHLSAPLAHSQRRLRLDALIFSLSPSQVSRFSSRRVAIHHVGPTRPVRLFRLGRAHDLSLLLPGLALLAPRPPVRAAVRHVPTVRFLLPPRRLPPGQRQDQVGLFLGIFRRQAELDKASVQRVHGSVGPQPRSERRCR